MGILNVTLDNFSYGGHHNLVEDTLTHARRMLTEGANIIDIGNESTRPGAELMHVQEELDRVLHRCTDCRGHHRFYLDRHLQAAGRRSGHSGQCLYIINDMHGLQGASEMAEVAALYGVPAIAMHWDKARDGAASPCWCPYTAISTPP